MLIGRVTSGEIEALGLPSGVTVSTVDLDAEAVADTSGRRFPPQSDDGGSWPFVRSLRLLHYLQSLSLAQSIGSVELPSCGGLAFCLLQERGIEGAFSDAKIFLRIDGLTLMEHARRGTPVDQAALFCADMERMCFLECDGLIAESAPVADSVRNFLRISADSWKPVQLSPLSKAVDIGSISIGAHDPIICFADELSSVKVFLRAAVGLIGSNPHWNGDVRVIHKSHDGEDALHVVPSPLRERFSCLGGSDALENASSAIVVFADRWSARADLARQLQVMGFVCVVNGANPVFDLHQGWIREQTVLCYSDNVGDLHSVLQRALLWSSSKRVVSSWSGEYGPVALPAISSAPTLPDAIPKVSVIVPHYNLGKWLPETLASIRASSYPNVEIVVVDDASTDDFSLRVIDELCASGEPDLVVHRLPFNRGLAGARNYGLSIATGEYILTLDADDIISPGFIEKASAALTRSNVHHFIVPRAAYFEGGVPASGFFGIAIGRGIPLVGEAWLSGLHANRFSTATCLARREVLCRLGYDEQLRAYEDWDIFQRALQEGCRFLVTNDVAFLYRQRQDSMIHSPQMRKRHAHLVAEMGSRSTLQGRTICTSLQSIQAVVAPPGVDGDPIAGLLLSEITSSLAEAERLRSSRVLRFVNRFTWLTRHFRRH
ncbi:glycosyltransferase family 2 protein [Stenotrophomonas bentonitica]|uniref:glycosyltransferase family 2 protein n=1 Tax=Stenotrophomonas bentonitica TaxID=1450134 RepID=UPI00345EE056